MDDIEKIYNKMEANCPNPCSTSKKLWELRHAYQTLSSCKPETMLEKAMAMLAARGHMPEWFNQCPVASGITDSSMSRQDSKAVNKKSNVDLVHWDEANKYARLVELKWESDTRLLQSDRFFDMAPHTSFVVSTKGNWIPRPLLDREGCPSCFARSRRACQVLFWL